MNLEIRENKNQIEDILGSRARVKILRILAKYEELTISLIIKKARLNYSCVVKHLKFLKKISLIQEKKFGRIKIYRYKSENIKARSFKNLIEIWEGVL
jgi:DNA-binding transcriptional ArsR family regulator